MCGGRLIDSDDIAAPAIQKARTHQKLNDEHDGEVGCENTHAAAFAGHTHDRLPDECQVDETSVGIAEGEAEELSDEGVLVLGCSAMILEVLRSAQIYRLFGEGKHTRTG